MKVETDLHEWLADAVSYDFLPDDIAEKSYKAISENEGRHPIGETCLWEFAEGSYYTLKNMSKKEI